MNERYVNSSESFAVAKRVPLYQTLRSAQTSDVMTNFPNDISNDVCINNPIILNQEEKEAFFKLIGRPSRPNEKLLKALRKFQ